MSACAIEAQGLAKHYPAVVAVDGIDLCVQSQTIYALLGPNGAGKTTLINMLTTMTLPSSGQARVAGFDVLRQADQVRRRIGVTFQELVLDRDLTGRQVLEVHGRLYRMPHAQRRARIAELVQLVQLEEAIDRRTVTYSGGMKRRLELARGLMTAPEVLFLDEPTQGLDPQNRAGIWEYIRMLNREQGLTVLLTTHYMEEAEALAERVGIVDHGRMLVEGRPAELVAALGVDTIRMSGHGDSQHLAEQLQQLAFVERIERLPDALLVSVDNGSRRLAAVVGAASGNGFVLDDVSVLRPTLGDVFLKYTGRALRD